MTADWGWVALAVPVLVFSVPLLVTCWVLDRLFPDWEDRL